MASPKDATCFYCVTAWEKANQAGSMYSRHLHAYSYDFRTAADPAAAKKPVQKKHPVPHDERDKVIHALSECYWIMKEWGIRSSNAQPHPTYVDPDYVSSPQTHKAIGDAIDDLHALQEKVRHL